MGYASTSPFGIFKGTFSDTYVPIVTMTTGDHTYTLGSIVTIDYKLPLSYCYATLIVPCRHDTSGALNKYSNTNIGSVTLSDGVTGIDCGQIPDEVFVVEANSYAYGAWSVPLNQNIAPYLKPNTTYTVYIQHGTSDGDDLILYLPRVELDMYFNMG